MRRIWRASWSRSNSIDWRARQEPRSAAASHRSGSGSCRETGGIPDDRTGESSTPQGWSRREGGSRRGERASSPPCRSSSNGTSTTTRRSSADGLKRIADDDRLQHLLEHAVRCIDLYDFHQSLLPTSKLAARIAPEVAGRSSRIGPGSTSPLISTSSKRRWAEKQEKALHDRRDAIVKSLAARFGYDAWNVRGDLDHLPEDDIDELSVLAATAPTSPRFIRPPSPVTGRANETGTQSANETGTQLVSDSSCVPVSPPASPSPPPALVS